MPRGVKKIINLEEELATVDAQIRRHEKSIVELKEKRSELQTRQQQQQAERLLQAVHSSGLSIDDAIHRISSEPFTQTAQA